MTEVVENRKKLVKALREYDEDYTRTDGAYYEEDCSRENRAMCALGLGGYEVGVSKWVMQNDVGEATDILRDKFDLTSTCLDWIVMRNDQYDEKGKYKYSWPYMAKVLERYWKL